MPKYQITIEREFVTYEQHVTTIEADNESDARKRAQEYASECNMGCPDDVESGTTEARDWEVWNVSPAPDVAEASE